MLVKKENTSPFKNSPDCTVWEHPHNTNEISLATVLINGRYPEEKRIMNKEVIGIFYVISGTGIIHSEKGDFELSPGDSYFIDKQEKYYITGENLSMTITNAPKWTPEQYENVDN